MVRANFTDGNNYTEAPGLTQWDYGQVLEIHGLDLPKAVEIHFAIYDCPDDAIIRIGNTIDKVTCVVVPEKIMEQPQDAVAYVYVSDTKSGETVRTVYMPMIPRQKPEAFDAPEDAELFKETIETVNAAADRAELAKSDAETARDAAQSTADETETARAEVEALKSQAQTAAESALLSEQNAKASDTAAQTAQAGAETAEGQAELFAGQAEESKNFVEAAKAVVMELGQKVADDKSNVEQAVSDFEIARQNAFQGIKDAENAALKNIGTGIDDTLTQSGKAAGAKATGDKLDSLKDDLVSIKEKAILSSNDFYLSVESAINKNYEYSFRVGHKYTVKNTSESSVFSAYTVEPDGVTEKEFVASGLPAGSEKVFLPTQNADIVRIVFNGVGSCEIIDNNSIEHDVKNIGNNLDKVIKCSEINDRSIYNSITSLINKQDVTFRNYPIFKQGILKEGAFVYNDKRCFTDLIKNSDFINWTIKNDSSKLKFNIVAYNSDKQLVAESGYVNLSSFTISSDTSFNTAYIRLIISKTDQTQTITPDECDIWLEKIVPYNSDTSNDVIHVKPDTNISQILQGVKYAYFIGAKKVVVEAGTYDILQEYKSIYGNDYFDNYN